MSRPRLPRLPLTPLIATVQAGTYSELARMLRYNCRAIQRAARDGLSELQADRWAVTLGYHPSEIWGDAWFEFGTDGWHCDICNSDFPTARSLTNHIGQSHQPEVAA